MIMECLVAFCGLIYLYFRSFHMSFHFLLFVVGFLGASLRYSSSNYGWIYLHSGYQVCVLICRGSGRFLSGSGFEVWKLSFPDPDPDPGLNKLFCYRIFGGRNTF
jgi:hypothetical protein